MVRSGVTYPMLVTLPVFQLLMSWLNANASENMYLYADTQHTKGKREGEEIRKEGRKKNTPSGHSTRQCC